MAYELYIGSEQEVLEVDRQIPEFSGVRSAESLQLRLADKESLLLVASYKSSPVAYKIGYRLTSTEFYSWLGGVVPEHRRKGLATRLRLRQETWALANGYLSIKVKSKNKFPEMLQMLISSGYLISNYEASDAVMESKITLVKKLSPQLNPPLK